MTTVQPAQKRIKNLSEVALGFSKREAMEEAVRCPQPAQPEHIHRCPLGIDIFGFIRRIREGDAPGALAKIREQNHFPGICGRICSAPCQKDLYEEEHWSIDIRALERYAADNGQRKLSLETGAIKKGKKIAVIGSGPSGLTAAADLANLGYSTVVFEALHLAGGILRYGIPEFRLPKKILDAEISYLKLLGVEIKTNCFIGPTHTLKELFDMGFSAVYLALGAGVPKFLGIPGENLSGVYSVSEYLLRANLTDVASKDNSLATGKKIVVVGTGTDALDCARVGIRLGKETVIVYELTQEEFKGSRKEIEYAKEEGVKFEMLTRPLEILNDGRNGVKGLRCIKMDFADSESTGKWRLMPVGDSEFIINTDAVVVSGGYRPNSFIGRFTADLKLNDDGSIWVDEYTNMTSIPGVFAGGDVVHGHNAVIHAMAASKKAAREINRYLQQKSAK